MGEIRRRKAAISLATRMADELVAKHRGELRGVTTVDGAKRALRGDVARARQQFNQRVSPERRAEKLFDAALKSALEAPAAPPRPIAPKVAVDTERPIGVADVGTAYRDAPPPEDVPLKPSRLDPPPSGLGRMRNQLMFGAAWIVVVARFSMAVRVHGVSKLAALQGLLGTISILPLVLGLLFLVLPRR